MTTDFDVSQVRFNSDGLVPVIAQEATSGLVLMLAWMNLEALTKTLELREAVYFSRSRNELWHKGSTSGNYQTLTGIASDCDGDTLLLTVRVSGPACHNGTDSCFDTQRIEYTK
ncbi:MAG: phosphoribosyl-AMP cyclohydrolase [Actinomycetota bacterium]|jgi:phosphoribosyl-AMP cyclohydrolase